jgi:hypothetical protein
MPRFRYYAEFAQISTGRTSNDVIFCRPLPRQQLVILKSPCWLGQNLVAAGAIYLAGKESSQILAQPARILQKNIIDGPPCTFFREQIFFPEKFSS